MKKTLLFLLLVVSNFVSYSQRDWLTKDLGSGITVKFPINPTYQVRDKAGVYLAVTETNTLTVLVKYDVLPHYFDFLKLSKEDQLRGIDVFLDNAIKGLLKASGNENIPYTTIQMGDNKGREVSYSAINHATSELTMHFIKMLYCANKVYLFQCMQLADNLKSSSERRIFLNSISSK